MRNWVAAACFAVLTGMAAGCDTGQNRAGELDPGTVPRDSVQVIVASSPEKLALLENLAAEFNDRKEKVGGKPVFVTIQRTSSGVGADLLAEDWPRTEGQQRPTVWSPAASLWGPIVNQRRIEAGKDAVVPEDFRPIMVTPVVIAMPEPMAQALGWPDTSIGWSDIIALGQDPAGWARFGHPEWGPFRLGKTDPNVSTTGFNATIAQAYAGAGKARDLTLADLDSPTMLAFMSAVESSVVHYGDTTLTFLNNLYRADERGAALSYISAVAVEEKSVIDYNAGNPDGITDDGEDPQPPRTRLVAVYPREGTLWSDNPYYILDAGWVSDSQREGAARFGDFIAREASQKKALAFGFRPADPNVALGSPIDAENGLNPSQPQTILPVPPGQVLFGIRDLWAATRKTARILMVLDVSGSMGEPAGAGRATKLDVAKDAVLAALPLFADRDEVGLWVFSTELDGTKDYKELAPVAPMSQNRATIERLVQGLSPLHGTGLYDTTEAAVRFMEPQASPDRITAVLLLTDGRNEDDTNNDLDGLVKSIGRQGELRKVRVFAIAYGEDASVEQLRAIAEATNGALYQSKDPKDIDVVFRNVVSNF
jgi:Ca-activated chloride channel family protein